MGKITIRSKRRGLRNAEIQKTMVLSTQHVSDTDYHALKKLADNGSAIEFVAYNTIRVLVLSPEDFKGTVSKTVMRFIKYAHSVGCTWLVLDPDASTLKGLKTFKGVRI